MTVARAIERACPDRRLVYFGDLARSPYGSKSPDMIEKYARENIEFLLSKGANFVVIACNSAASVAAETMRREFDQPIFDVIAPAVAKAGEISRGLGKRSRVGVIGTRATIKSGIYSRQIHTINPEAAVYSIACPLLVPLVEEGWLNKRETKMILRRYLNPLRMKQIDALVLGCTHYPLLTSLIQPRVGKRVRIIDSSVEVALVLRDFLARYPDNNDSEFSKRDSEFYVSDITEAARDTACKIFGRHIELLKV